MLVSTDWVAAHLNDPSVRIVESNEDTLLYPSGHIPGAVQVDWTADLNDPLKRDYITRKGFEALMSRIGVTPKTTVVFYGDKNNWWACYAFWVFQLFGHKNARVMDGGRVKWEKEGRAMTRDVPAFTPTKYKAPERKDAPIRAFRQQVLAHVKAKGQLVDVRSPEEYAGTRMHMPTTRTKARCAAATFRARRASVGARGQSRRRHVQDRGGAGGALRQDEQAQEGQADDRLLPHRRAQQPHVVRAEVSARLQERQELRRLLDRVGQFGRSPDREVARGR